jgi:RNA polymerase sigma-70 factor (ECF subfamily)
MIARRLAMDLLRRPSSRTLPPQPDPAHEHATQPDVSDTVLTRLIVDQAIGSLSPPHREVLILSYQHQLTQPEIAEVLGIPLGTVKTRTFYALRALKLALAERDIHD